MADDFFDAASGVGPAGDDEQLSPEAKVLPLHYAAFVGEAERARSAWGALSWADRVALDPRGNTALHVAVLRGNRNVLEALLDLGLSCELRNARGFTPLQDAAAAGDADFVRLMVQHRHGGARAEFERQRPQILRTLASSPDFRMALKWELRSFLFGSLLRRYTPHDTYAITKVGSKLRVDGTLTGLDDSPEAAQAMLPRWKRDKFSLVMIGAASGAGSREGVDDSKTQLYLLQHGNKEAIDMLAKPPESEGGKGESKEQQIDMEVNALMAEGGQSRSKFSMKDVKFGPAKSWLFGSTVREKVYGWTCQVFDLHFTASTAETVRQYVAGGEAKVRPAASCTPRWRRCPAADSPPAHAFAPRSQGTFEEYLAGLEEERVSDDGAGEGSAGGSEGVAPLDDSEAAGGGNDTALGRMALNELDEIVTEEEALGEGASTRTTKKRIKGRCWMAHQFPLDVSQLLPLLSVVKHVNKQVGRLVSFFHKWDEKVGPDLFPVRILLPIMFTIAAHVSFKRFKPLENGEADVPEGHFNIMPEGYTLKTLHEALAENDMEMEHDGGGRIGGGPFGKRTAPFGTGASGGRPGRAAGNGGKSDEDGGGESGADGLAGPDLERLAREAEAKGDALDTSAIERYCLDDGDDDSDDGGLSSF